jgi:manganese/zinc/iron transport system ATP- binding protein
MNALAIDDLTVSYREAPVLWDIHLHLPSGQRIAIIGPNGAGKSTLLKAVMGFIPVVSGQVRIFGEPLDGVRTRVAYVPQRSEVDWDYPISVMETVLMGRYGHLRFPRRPGRDDRRIARQALEEVGMTEFAGRQISQLSGGQQQRVFIARALAQQAELYLMDEPFAGVDVATEKTITALFERLRAEGRTVVCVHHDLATVREYFDHVALINLRRIADGPVEVAFTPENLEAAYGGRLGLLADVTERIRRHGVVPPHV